MFLKCITTVLLIVASGYSINVKKQVIAFDYYHHNETPQKYAISDTGLLGYSIWTKIILSQGADTLSIKKSIDSQSLAAVSMLVIVDPDTTSENPNPKFIQSSEITAIEKWVQAGGKLLLLANNAKNCEFTNFNLLANKFGVKFNGDNYGSTYYLAPLPNHPFFAGCDTVFIKDISTLSVLPPAEVIFKLNNKNIMALTKFGKGIVFSLGDPWAYNEYMGNGDNIKALTNITKWFLDQQTNTQNNKKLQNPIVNISMQSEIKNKSFLLNGKLVSPWIMKNSDFQNVSPAFIIKEKK
jgi:unsaturated rhamnogalacturonyl hydrolase